MRGIFLSFDETSGRGRIEADGHHYEFESATLPLSVTVRLGQPVNFIARGDTVTGIWAATSSLTHRFAWRWFLFSFQGRISRGHFWLRYWLPTRLALLFWLLAGKYAGLSVPRSWGTDALLVGLVLMMLWSETAVEVKRWHDRNKSGWWMLVYLIPLIGPFWVLAECGLLRGREGHNRFGPDPVAAT